MSELENIVEKCLKPLDEPSPAGEDAKYDLLFGLVRDEIERLTGKIDWEKIVNDCVTLLSEKSKDLNIAGFLTLAIFRQSGYQGLVAGLRIYHGILTGFDGEYYPKGENEKRTYKVRQASLKWIEDPDRLTLFIQNREPEATEANYVIEAFDELNNIKAVVSDMFTPPVTLSRLLNAVGEHRQKAEKLVSEKQAEVTEHPQNPDSGAASRNTGTTEVTETEQDAAPQPVPPEETEPQNMPEAQKQEFPPAPPKTAGQPSSVPAVDIKWSEDPTKALISISTGLRTENPANPVPYRLLRIARWDGLKDLPPKKPPLAAPHFNHINRAKRTFETVDPQITISTCESSFAAFGLWWLDLQRVVFNALQKAGTEYAQAAEAVKSETKRMVRRFPDVIHMTYSDGMPFADNVTKGWIEDLLTDDTGTGSSSAAADDELEKELLQAKKIAGEQKLPEALALLQKQADGAASGRDVFRCRLTAARLCLANGRPFEARIIFEDLYNLAEDIRLEEWEPQLFLDMCTGLEKIYRRDEDQISPEKTRKIQEAILRINLGFSLDTTNLKG